MSKIEKMSIGEIFDSVQLMLRENDIIYFCRDEETIQEFSKLRVGNRVKREELREFLVTHEDKIDKEKLLLLVVKNYQDNIKTLERLEKEAAEQVLKQTLETEQNHFTELHNESLKYKTQLYVQKEQLQKAKKLAKGIGKCIVFYHYDPKEGRYYIEVADSREIIDGIAPKESSNAKRFKQLDDLLKEDKGDLGIEYILQSVVLTDFCEIFPDAMFGDLVRTMILENGTIREGIKTQEELQRLRIEDYEEYTNIVDKTDFVSLLPDIKETLKEYIAYVDLDKLLMISAYRFQEGLESKGFKLRDQRTIRNILQFIEKNIKKDKTTLDCMLQNKRNGSYQLEPVKYGIEDVRDCIKRMCSEGYLTTSDKQTYRDKIDAGEIDLFDMSPEYVNIIFSEDELAEKAMLNDNNFKYVALRLKWPKEKLLEMFNHKGACSTSLISHFVEQQQMEAEDIVALYMERVISLEQIVELKEKIDISQAVNAYELNQYYQNSMEQQASEEQKEQFDQYLQLYQNCIITGKSKKELDIASNQLLEEMVEKYQEENREAYIQQIERFYQAGLITLNTLLEWDNEELITRLHQDGIIHLQEIESLVKEGKLPFEYIHIQYLDQAKNPDIEYEERLRYIRTGYIQEEDILQFYNQNLIFEKDLKELAEEGFVSQEVVERVIKNSKKEELEAHSAIKLVGLNQLSKRNHKIYLEDTEEDKTYHVEERKAAKEIIDPNEREMFIHLLGAHKAITDLEEESPFYHYEFYVIPDESGEIGLNSVVIAERYYDDKETEEKFALANATYFFQYKDLMVLSKLKKSEMTKERKNIVFTANHTLATEKKNGHWAASVIYGIVKTMLSSDLKEYSEENQRKIVLEKLNQLYSHEEILAILDKAAKIDRGEDTYEIVHPDDTALKRENKKKEQEDMML